MALLTRLRSSTTHIPLPITRTYYTQRASTPDTLLITEATFTSSRSRRRGANVPRDLHIRADRRVEDHRRRRARPGQLHLLASSGMSGRAARSKELARLGLQCVSSGAVKMFGAGRLVANIVGAESDEYDVLRELGEEEIWGVIKEFAEAARCAVCEVAGDERGAVRLSPWSTFQGMRMENPVPQFTYLVERLKGFGLACLRLIELRVAGIVDRDVTERESLDCVFDAWGNVSPVILAGGFTPESARVTVEDVRREYDVAIAFGRHFISNPDLPKRILNGIELSRYNRETFYPPEAAEGYID